MNIKKAWRENRALFIMIAVTAVAITTVGILFKQSPLRVLPLYNSLVIMALNARANRYALLYGAANSVLYAVADYSYGLYGQVIYALFVSTTVQLVTFILYNRRKYGSSTLFRRMSALGRVMTAVGFAVAWVGVMLTLRAMGGSYAMLDTTVTLFGFLVTGLAMFAFIEAPILNVLSQVVSIGMNLKIVLDGAYDRSTHLVYAVYCIICVIMGAVRTVRLYREQQQNKENLQGEKI